MGTQAADPGSHRALVEHLPLHGVQLGGPPRVPPRHAAVPVAGPGAGPQPGPHPDPRPRSAPKGQAALGSVPARLGQRWSVVKVGA